MLRFPRAFPDRPLDRDERLRRETEDLRFQRQECRKRLRELKHGVAVVGGGFAGVMAAWELSQHGVKVTVYEANTDVGGRVRSNPNWSEGRITEEGAELIGSFHTNWLSLARRYGLAMVSRMEPDLYRCEGLDVKLTLDQPLSMTEFEQLSKAMEKRILRPIALLALGIRDPSRPWKQRTLLKRFDGMSVQDALPKFCPIAKRTKGNKDERLWKMIEFKLVNDEVASLDEMNFLGLLCKVRGGQGQRFGGGLKPLLMGYWDELEIFRCADGCQQLSKEMTTEISQKDGKIWPNTFVKVIDISKEHVTLTWVPVREGKPASGSGQSERFDYVIFAVPPSVWDGVTINVDGTKVDPTVEIGQIGMAPAVKFFSDVKERFWIKSGAAPYGGSLKLGQVWEGTDNQTRVEVQKCDPKRREKQGIILSVFAGPLLPGPRVPTEKEFKDELKKLYPDYDSTSPGTVRKTRFANWPDERFIKTGYVSPRINQLLDIGEKLSKPFHDRLFFAGEHTQMDFFGYMEGALRSGERAARTLMLKACGLIEEPAPKLAGRPAQTHVARPASPPISPMRSREATAFEREREFSLQEHPSTGHFGEAESPFVYQELFFADSATEKFEPRAAALVTESPFAGALDDRRSGFGEELTEGEALDELDEREEADELEAERIWEELEEELQTPPTDQQEYYFVDEEGRSAQISAPTPPEVFDVGPGNYGSPDAPAREAAVSGGTAMPEAEKQLATTICGFHGPKGVVSLAAVRKAVVDAAVGEHTNWFMGGPLQLEVTPGRHGDLVRYFLAGNRGSEDIRPDILLAAMHAASMVSNYDQLRDADIDRRVQDFAALNKRLEDATKDLLKKWDDFDLHTEQLKEAQKEVRAAQRVLARTTTVVARDKAANALKDEKKKLDEAKKKVAASKIAIVDARANRTKAKLERDPPKDKVAPKDTPAAKASALKPAHKKKVLDELLKISPPTGVSKLDEKMFENAIIRAHRSRSDIEAWSAVFISAVVRLAAIAQQLEMMDGRSHRGTNVLLLVSNRHWEYVKEARRRASKTAGYQAFDVAGRVIKTGDIVVQDRTAELARAVALKDLDARELHGDVVTRIVEDGGVRYAEAVGGNVGHSVRRRRFPLNDRGHLITARQQRFLQEGDDGTFTVPAPLPRDPSRLPPDSTARIFAVLSLVEECKPVGASEAEWTGGEGMGNLFNFNQIDRLRPSRLPARTPRIVADVTESYESPFLDEVSLSVPRPAHDEDSFRVQTGEEQDAALALENGDGSTAEPRAWWLGDEPQPFAGFETEAEEQRGPEDREDEAYFEEEWKDLAAAETIDAECAQPLYAQAVRDRLEPLLDAKGVRAASAWNTAQHPGKSEVSTTALSARLGQYLNRPAIETAMRNSAELKNLAGDAGAVLAVMTHQFQQKIYFAGTAKEREARYDGRIGEGTLDALGFVRHRGRRLNTVDRLNADYHLTGKSKAFKRVQQAHQDDPRLFDTLGTDVDAKTWYYLFVNGPFLGRPFTRGIQVELMRRLRKAERWLCVQPQYRGLSPVELGAALGIDEDHSGGRTTSNSSMHTLGLAVDIGYTKNPWVAGQHGPTGMPNTTRNTAFKAVTRNVSRLVTGTDEVLTPQWLASLSSAAGQTTARAYDEVQRRHTNLRDYLGLESDPVRLKTLIQQRSQGAHPEWVIRRGETVDDAVKSWRRRIAADRVSLRTHLPRSNPGLGFLNHHRDLVIALRDHGCLAWGAIDLGRNANGDMMHFDCRATGIGWALALDRQRTTGVSHRCHTAATTQELESRTAPATVTTSPEISEELDLDETVPGGEDELLSWVLEDQEHEEEGIPITPTEHRESPFRDEEIQGIEPEADEELEVEDEFDEQDFEADEFEAGEFEAEDVETEQLEADDEAFEGESFDDQDEGELEVVEECEDAFGDDGESEEPATDYQAGEWDAG